MKPRFRGADLNAEIVFDRHLGAADDLDLIQELLAEAAPRWCAQLPVWRGPRDQRPIDVAEPRALRTAVLEAAGERGPTYRALVERYGAGDERLFGSAELRGAGLDVIVVISVDERVVSRLGDMAALGNHIAFQVRRSKVADRPGAVWIEKVFETFCDRLSPVWRQAGHPDEYWAKVMSERPSIAAVGRDFGRFLPGVFWLNFFGRRYRELFGDDRLGSTPASRVAGVDDGVLVGLGLEPSRWDIPEYAAAEQRVRDRTGPEPPMLTRLLTGQAATPRDERAQDGPMLRRSPSLTTW
jgi:hypothetical protein